MTFRDQGHKRFPADLRKEIWELGELVAAAQAGCDPVQQNLIGWTYDPQSAGDGSSVVGGGFEHLLRVVPVRDATVKNVILNLTGAGATLTAGQCFAGLRDRFGNLLGKTADQSTNWAGALVPQVMPLDTAPVVQAGVPVYVCILANGTTKPSFSRLSSKDIVNVGCLAGQGRTMSDGGGNTDLASTKTMAGLGMTNVIGWWAAIS